MSTGRRRYATRYPLLALLLSYSASVAAQTPAATGGLLLEHVEYTHSHRQGDAIDIDSEAWYGNAIDKLWLTFEGTHDENHWEDLRTEAFWQHSLNGYWNSQLGIRHDHNILGHSSGNRTWAALSLEGPVPYWLETQATIYLGSNSRTAMRLTFDYDMEITQKLVLQPDMELNFYSKDDPQNLLGHGLASTEVGLRLRYRLTPYIAPYIGIIHEQHHGKTRRYRQAYKEPYSDRQFVAGFRIHL